MKLEKLILGTVQFGLSYGINNSGGQISAPEAAEILKYARSNGITLLDTAAAYGNAEEVIGHFHREQTPFRIITKFDKENRLSWDESLRGSIARLRVSKVEYAMFHSFEEYLKNKNALPGIVSGGKGVLFDKIGVSVYTNEEMRLLADDENVEVVQLPFNLLDNEQLRGKTIELLKRKGKTVHTRSVFLQGLFFKEISLLGTRFQGIKELLSEIHYIALKYNVSVSTLALQYVMSKDYIDGVLIGVDSRQQLEENINSLTSKVDIAAFTEIDRLKTEDTELLNPSKW